MTNGDLNQIRGVVKEEINSALEPIKETLADHTKKLEDHTQKLDTLWEQTVKLTEDMAEVQETLASHTTSLKIIVTNTEHEAEKMKKLNEAPRANARGIFSLASAERNLAEAENSHSSTVWQPWSSAKADKRVGNLEDQAGIVPPSELTIAG